MRRKVERRDVATARRAQLVISTSRAAGSRIKLRRSGPTVPPADSSGTRLRQPSITVLRPRSITLLQPLSTIRLRRSTLLRPHITPLPAAVAAIALAAVAVAAAPTVVAAAMAADTGK